MESELIVNHIDGTQIVISVDEGGGYFDLSKVLWDTRIDGPFPKNALDPDKIGGWIRDPILGLIYDEQTKIASDKAVATAQSEKDRISNQIDARKMLIKSIGVASSVDDLKKVLIAVIQQIGLDR